MQNQNQIKQTSSPERSNSRKNNTARRLVGGLALAATSLLASGHATETELSAPVTVSAEANQKGGVEVLQGVNKERVDRIIADTVSGGAILSTDNIPVRGGQDHLSTHIYEVTAPIEGDNVQIDIANPDNGYQRIDLYRDKEGGAWQLIYTERENPDDPGSTALYDPATAEFSVNGFTSSNSALEAMEAVLVVATNAIP